jgi:hypothetical protein
MRELVDTSAWIAQFSVDCALVARKTLREKRANPITLH